MAIDLSSQFIDETGMGTRKCWVSLKNAEDKIKWHFCYYFFSFIKPI